MATTRRRQLAVWPVVVGDAFATSKKATFFRERVNLAGLLFTAHHEI